MPSAASHETGAGAGEHFILGAFESSVEGLQDDDSTCVARALSASMEVICVGCGLAYYCQHQHRTQLYHCTKMNRGRWSLSNHSPADLLELSRNRGSCTTPLQTPDGSARRYWNEADATVMGEACTCTSAPPPSRSPPSSAAAPVGGVSLAVLATAQVGGGKLSSCSIHRIQPQHCVVRHRTGPPPHEQAGSAGSVF